MSRIPLPYSKKVLDLFKNPLNQGEMKDATVTAVAGSPACGDMIAIYLKINDKEVVENATFESYGCAANIAASSILTEMIKNKGLREAWGVTWKDVSDELGGLPAVKYHCGILAVGALRRAIREYYKMKKLHPEWLPKKVTPEEKQALEEERLTEILMKKFSVKKVE